MWGERELDFMVQRCRETTVVLGLTVTIHTKGIENVTIFHWGINKSVIREHEQMPVWIGILLTDH